MAMFVHRHSDGKDQFDAVMSAVKASPDMIALGKDGRGEDRFTSREMIETEQRLDRAVERLSDGRGFGLPTADRKSVVEGKSVSVRVDPGGRRNLKKKKT